MNRSTKITIITATIDFTEALAESARSILPCLSENVQWLVFSKHPLVVSGRNVRFDSPHVKIITEKDTGLYDALNKALHFVSHGFVQIVGAGDTLIPPAFRNALKVINQNSDLPIHSFPILLEKNGQIYGPDVSKLPMFMSCPHPGLFVDVDLIKFVGGFDVRYRISADYDLISRLAQNYPIQTYGFNPILSFLGGGISDVYGQEALLENALIKLRVWKKPLNEVARII